MAGVIDHVPGNSCDIYMFACTFCQNGSEWSRAYRGLLSIIALRIKISLEMKRSASSYLISRINARKIQQYNVIK